MIFFVLLGSSYWTVELKTLRVRKYVTLHGTLMLKVIARSRHTNTARLACPGVTDMRVFNSLDKGRHSWYCSGRVDTLSVLDLTLSVR